MLTVRLALCVGKAVHEHGHGLAARLPGAGDGSRLVLAPVLWIGIAGAWKLVRRRDRLLIDASGMLAEISLASPAALLWCVLGDGPLRNACFTLSRSTWLLTLAVNLSPLIRFDGYYILSDSLGFPNLLDRGPCRRDRPAPHPARRSCPLLSGRRQPGDPGNGEPRCRGVGPYQRRAGIFLDQPGTGCRTRGPVPEGAIYPPRACCWWRAAGGGRALRRVRGAVVIRGERASLVAHIYRQVVGVGIRETGLQAARSLTGTSREPAASRGSQGPDQALRQRRAGIRRSIDSRCLPPYGPCCPYKTYDSDEAG